VLWELARHPSARFLRELVIGCHHAGDQSNELMAAMLIHAGPTPPLRALYLADFDDTHIDNIDISRAPIGDLTGLTQTYPRLEDVILKGRGDGPLGELHVPHVRRFAFRTSSLTAANLERILHADWPMLEELELWFGDEEYNGDPVEAGDALRILRLDLPRLRTLRLMNAPWTDGLVEPLARNRLLRQLASVDLGLGTLTDDGAAAIARHADAFVHLRELAVGENCLTERGLQALRATRLPITVEQTLPSRGYWNGRQKGRRYVSVSE
jgi:hypothetical protein